MKGWRRLVPESFVTVRFTEREERASLQSPREVSILAPPRIEQLWREEIDQKVCREVGETRASPPAIVLKMRSDRGL